MQPLAPQFTNAYQVSGLPLSFAFSWTPIANATYTLYRNNVAIYPGITGVQQGDDQVVPHVQYIYAVSATVAGVESPRSVPVVMTLDLTNLPYASPTDLAGFWRTLTTDEAARANVLLALATNRLRQIADNVNVNIDARVAATPAYAATAQWVVMESVKRAMLVPTNAPPANQLQTTAGPYSENIIFTNPSGDLWFKNSELKDLGLWGVQSLSSLSTAPRWDIYGS